MTLTRWRIALAAAALVLAGTSAVRADADADWKQVEAMETNPPAAQWKTRDEARAGTIEYLGKQEHALRGFIAGYPDDPHTPEAKLRLAHLLATRADMEEEPHATRDRSESTATLDELERDPAMRDRRADAEFARLSIFMQRVDAITGSNRKTLLEKARAFAKEFPDDHRVPALLAEVAGAFQDQPETARALLEEAQSKAANAGPEVRARIADDLKRLSLLGKPLAMKWTSVAGTAIDLEKLRGRVVLIYYFASWSAPSMQELDWVKQLALGGQPVAIQALGICLDNDPVTATTILADKGIKWPVYCDGRGWQGTLVRSLGINALPALWVIDRNGVLQSVDAKQDAAELIQKAEGE